MGIVPIGFASCLILLPASAPHGALFAFGCTLYSRFRQSLGRGYVLEALGTILGGVVWTFVLASHVHSFHVCVGLGAVNGLVCSVLLSPRGVIPPGGGDTRGAEAPSGPGALICLLLGMAGLGALLAGVGDRLHRGSLRTQLTNR